MLSGPNDNTDYDRMSPTRTSTFYYIPSPQAKYPRKTSIVTQIRLNSKEGSTENTEILEMAALTKKETQVAFRAVSYLQSPGQQKRKYKIQKSNK